MDNVQNPPLQLTNKQLSERLYRITCISVGLAKCYGDLEAQCVVDYLLEGLDAETAWLYNYFSDLADQEGQQEEQEVVA